MKKRLWAWLVRLVERHYTSSLVNGSLLDRIVRDSRAIDEFCSRSGFLRDGRYPGGRHAERKLRKLAADVSRHVEQATQR